MEATQFDQLSLRDKESLLKERGHLIEAQDFYSFYVLLYALDQHTISLTYDFSGDLLDLHEHHEPDPDDSISQAVRFFSP